MGAEFKVIYGMHTCIKYTCLRWAKRIRKVTEPLIHADYITLKVAVFVEYAGSNQVTQSLISGASYESLIQTSSKNE